MQQIHFASKIRIVAKERIKERYCNTNFSEGWLTYLRFNISSNDYCKRHRLDSARTEEMNVYAFGFYTCSAGSKNSKLLSIFG